MPDVPAWLIVAGGAVGYLIALLQYRATRQSNEDTVDTAKRREILDTYRWAAELAADESELKRQLGVNALEQLASYPELTAEDRKLIVAALDVALATAEASATVTPQALERGGGPDDATAAGAITVPTPSQRSAARLKLRLAPGVEGRQRDLLERIATGPPGS